MITFYMHDAALDAHDDGAPWRGQGADGYGSRIRTSYVVTCPDGRTRRVYVCQYGATGAYYVNVRGARVGLATSYAPVRPSAHGAA